MTEKESRELDRLMSRRYPLTKPERKRLTELLRLHRETTPATKYRFDKRGERI